MGTYTLSSDELANELRNALDSIEGDFDTKTLRDALLKVSGYESVTDNTSEVSLKELLKSLYEKNENFDIFDLIYEVRFHSLPKVIEDYGTEKKYEEDIAFENQEIHEINLDTNTIVLSAGGDWQDPLRFSITLKGDGRFHYNNDAVPENNWKDGLPNEEVKKLLGIN